MSRDAPEAVRLFDAHLHIVDPRFPLEPTKGFRPEPFTVDDYRARTAHLDVVGGAVVAGSFQGFDQTHLLDALERLGPVFVGVTQLPASADDRQVIDLDAAGVRALRFNLRRGAAPDLGELERLARRVFELVGWHVEVYVDGRELAALESWLGRLPQLVIDHLGLAAAGRDPLLRLVERGARVKASGFARLDFDPADVLRRIHAVDPSALVFGTDLPGTRAPRPFEDRDLLLVREALGEAAARRVLVDNARVLYGDQPSSNTRRTSPSASTSRSTSSRSL
jgi:predicted TIM-barrel fold metal-dependent hydrolase